MLRLGGSLSDAVEYTPAPCASFARDDGRRLGFGDGCLGLARWDALHAFCADVGCRTIFTLNALRGRTRATCPDGTDCRNARPAPSCCTEYSGRWDGSGAAALLRRAAERRQPLAAVALGNELGGAKAIEAHLDAAEYAADLAALDAMLKRAWPPPREPPLLVAPNVQWPATDDGWLGELLAAPALPPLGALSLHAYPLGPGNMSVRDMTNKMLRADFLERLQQTVAGAQRLLLGSPRQRSAALWVAELGGAYNSGRHGATDVYVSSFWYADALGSLARLGAQTVCRQTLLGGSYSLLSLGWRHPAAPQGDDTNESCDGWAARGECAANSYFMGITCPLACWVHNKSASAGVGTPALPRRVHPDFYTAALWRALMGPTVLRAAVRTRLGKPRKKGRAEDSDAEPRAYAACTPPSAARGGGMVPPIANATGALTLLVVNPRRHRLSVPLAPLLTRWGRGAAGACDDAAAWRTADLRDEADPLAPWSRGEGGPAVELAHVDWVWSACAARCAANASCVAFAPLPPPGSWVNHAGRLERPVGACALYPPAACAAADPSEAALIARAPSSWVEATAPVAKVAPAAESLGRLEYRLNASSLHAAAAMLNGETLVAEAGGARGALPTLAPLVVDAAVEAAAGEPSLEVGRQSLAFFVFPRAAAPECA